MGRRRPAQQRLDRAVHGPLRWIGEPDRNPDPRRQASDVSTARGAGAWRKRRAERKARLETHVLGKFLRAKELKQPEKSMCIVLEWRRTQEQHVAAQRRNGRDGTPARLTGVARRATKPLRFVDDEQIDS